jgi:hypothetical protein
VDPSDCECHDYDIEEGAAFEDYGETELICFNCHESFNRHTKQGCCLFSSTRWRPSLLDFVHVEDEDRDEIVERYELMDFMEVKEKFVKFEDVMRMSWRHPSPTKSTKN